MILYDTGIQTVRVKAIYLKCIAFLLQFIFTSFSRRFSFHPTNIWTLSSFNVEWFPLDIFCFDKFTKKKTTKKAHCSKSSTFAFLGALMQHFFLSLCILSLLAGSWTFFIIIRMCESINFHAIHQILRCWSLFLSLCRKKGEKEIVFSKGAFRRRAKKGLNQKKCPKDSKLYEMPCR